MVWHKDISTDHYVNAVTGGTFDVFDGPVEWVAYRNKCYGVARSEQAFTPILYHFNVQFKSKFIAQYGGGKRIFIPLNNHVIYQCVCQFG